MKKSYAVLLCVLMFSFGNISAQINTALGHEFWLTFTENFGSNTGCNDKSLPELKVVISASNACKGVVKNLVTKDSFLFSIGNGGGFDTVLIPAYAAYISKSENDTQKNRGLYIYSKELISVSAQNSKVKSADASLIYPIEALGVEYRILSHVADQTGSNTCYRSCFAIVATEDSTLVDITSSCNTEAGKLAGVMFTKVLNKGESYLIKAASHRYDLSGTLVKSRNCKKIAVFAGANAASVLYGTCSSSYEHLWEQLMPINLWSTKYTCIPSQYSNKQKRKGDMVKVVAAFSSTSVRCNGRVKILAAGQADTFFIQSNSILLSNKPIGVCQFGISEACDINSGTGADPMMVWVAPLEQASKDLSFVYDSSQSKYFCLQVVTKTSHKNVFKLNGYTPKATWSIFDKDSTYSFLQLDSFPLGLNILNSDSGISARAYGYGAQSGMGYNLGSLYTPKKFYVRIGGINSDSNNNLPFMTCLDAPLTFEAHGNNETGVSWKWLVYDQNGVVVKTIQKFNHSFKYAGVFKVVLVAQYSVYGQCNGLTVQSDSLFFNVKTWDKPTLDFNLSHAEVCKDSMLTVGIKNLNFKKISSSFWTLNNMDTLRNDTVVYLKLNKSTVFVFSYLDSNTCRNVDSIRVEPLPTLGLNLPDFAGICEDDTLMVSLPKGLGRSIKKYLWFQDDTLLKSTDSFYLFSGKSTTKISLKIVDQYSCVTLDSVRVLLYPKPVFQIVSQDTFLYRDTVKLTCDKPFKTYNWFDGDTTAMNVFLASRFGAIGNHLVWCKVVDVNGCVGIDSQFLYIEGKKGLGKNKINQILVYPNPTNKEISIRIGQVSALKILNMQGICIRELLVEEGINVLNVSDLEAGLYVISVADVKMIFIKQ